MSRAAETWFFDECQVRGNEGWVLVSLCNYADDDGYAALSKKSLVAKTHMSEATVYRALETLNERGVLAFVTGETGPSWWELIPANRRPRLVKLIEFLGSRFATPTGPGVSQGYQNQGSGVSQGYHGTPSDLHKQNASLDGVTDTQSRARAEGKCGEWVDVPDAKVPTVAPCILDLDHDGPCESKPGLSLVGRERKDTA